MWVVLNGAFSVMSLCAGVNLSFIITLLWVTWAMSLISSDHWSTSRCLELAAKLFPIAFCNVSSYPTLPLSATGPLSLLLSKDV